MVTYIEYVKVPMPARQVLLLRSTFSRLVEASQPRELKIVECYFNKNVVLKKMNRKLGLFP